MARIKVIGYMDEDELNPEHLDGEHETGLSEAGFNYWSGAFMELDDLTFRRVEE